MSYLFEVVVLTAHAQAFLRVGHAAAFGFGVSEDDILELVHPGVGKHQCRVVLDYHRSGGDDEVSVLLKEALVGFAYFVCCHHIVFLMYLGAKLQFSKRKMSDTDTNCDRIARCVSELRYKGSYLKIILGKDCRKDRYLHP